MNNQDKINKSHDYWNVKKAGNHLLFKLSPYNGKFKTINVTEDDFNALKSVLGYVNRVESGLVNNNQLFAKLFLMELVGQIRENGTTVFNQMVFQNVSNQLAKPLDLFYKAFYEDLCSNQLLRLSEDAFKDEKGMEVVLDYKRFKETYSLQFVTEKLDEMMNHLLHKRS